MIIPEPNTEEWLKFRKNRIGASDAKCIMGADPWTSPRKLFDIKSGAFEDKRFMSEAMKRGVRLEPHAREELSLLLGMRFDTKAFLHSEHDWMMASLDCWNETNKVAAEIKCPTPGNEDYRKGFANVVPDKYVPQLQHQIVVKELDWAYYVTYSEMEIHYFKVYRDDLYIKSLMSAEIEFINRLRDFDPPDSDEDYEDLSNNHNWNEWAKEYDNAELELKSAESKKAQAREMLIAIAGDKNCKGNGFKISKRMRKGQIQYKDMPEIKGKDLEPYRSKPSSYWLINRQGTK